MNNDDFYRTDTQDYIDKTFNIDMNALYKPFLELLNPGSKILDLGFGSGRDSLFFSKRGFIVVSLDNSPGFIDHAHNILTNQIIQMDMRELSFNNEFDGIWACASLLHIPKNEIVDVLKKCFRALKISGIFYLSFKYGEAERVAGGRFFNDYNESSFLKLISPFSCVTVVKIWKSQDSRKECEEQYWLNILLRKVM